MQVLAFVNQKGGTGKTTATVHLAGALAARGRRVLVIDCDPQAHATLALGVAPDAGRTLAAVLADELTIDDVALDAPGDLRIVPADLELSDFEERAGQLIHPEGRLLRALEASSGDWDEVLLDCPPRMDGALAKNALRAADTAVLVVETGAFALQGAVRANALLDELRAERTQDGDAFELRVLATLFDRRQRLAREILYALATRFSGSLFDTVIRTSVRLREAAAAGLPVHLYEPSSRAARDFRELAEEWLRSQPKSRRRVARRKMRGSRPRTR